MIKRPINARFSDAVRTGRKTTTIRKSPWPIGTPIMLYNWAGLPYRSKHVDVVSISVISAKPITIVRTKLFDSMVYQGVGVDPFKIYITEGFNSQFEMDEWFRRLVKPGQAGKFFLMKFKLWVKKEGR